VYSGKVNPVARSNVCPEIIRRGAGFHAFSFTVPAAADAAPSFVIPERGSESHRGELSRTHHPVGETSPDAMREKRMPVGGDNPAAELFSVGCAAPPQAKSTHPRQSIRFLPRDRPPRRGPCRRQLAFHRPPVRD